MNNLNKTTKFSVTSYDRTTTVEVDHCDVDMEEFLDIVKVLAIGMTFHEDTFKRCIIELGAQYEEEMREKEDRGENRKKLEDDFFGKWSESDLDEAFAQHNEEEEGDWDVTLNDGLEEDGWTEELEKQYWEAQFPSNEKEPISHLQYNLNRDAMAKENSVKDQFDDYGKRIEKVEKKKKKDAKRK
jgi:hypothetical protein